MLRFAPRYGIVSPCIVRRRAVRTGHPANDNTRGQRRRVATRASASPEAPAANEALLDAALRLFAAHGLSAARRAREAAEIARQHGREDEAQWWIAVCATLDSGMAQGFARRGALAD